MYAKIMTNPDFKGSSLTHSIRALNIFNTYLQSNKIKTTTNINARTAIIFDL
jgi:hypothetical protein